MKKSILFLLALTIVCSCIFVSSLPVFASDPLVDGGVYTIMNQRSGWKLSIIERDTGTFFYVQQVRDYMGADIRCRFKLKKVGSDWEFIPMFDQARRLDVRDRSTENHADIIAYYKSTGASNQRFRILDDGNGTGHYKILTAITNYTKCVTVLKASYDMSAPIIQYTYQNDGTNDNDHWWFVRDYNY